MEAIADHSRIDKFDTPKPEKAINIMNILWTNVNFVPLLSKRFMQKTDASWLFCPYKFVIVHKKRFRNLW